MKRKLLLIHSVFILALLAVSLDAIGDETRDPFRIGVILPLSGANAFGEGMRKGCEMAAHELKARNSPSYPIQLFFEDDQYNPVKTLSAFRKLLEHEKIDAVITVSTGPTRAVLSTADTRKIPLIAIATNDGFTTESKYAFSLWLPPELEAGAMADEALRRGYKQLARVSAQNPVFESLNKHFDKGVNGRIEVVLDEEFNPGETDFRSVISKIKAVPEIDAIVVNLLPAGAGSFARQARDLGVTHDLFAAEIFESPEAIKLSGGALEGQWYATYANPQSDFDKKFRAQNPDTMIIGAANCYDAIHLISASLRNGEDQLLDTLSQVRDYNGALGKLSIRPDRSFQMPAAIRVVRGEGYVQIRIFGG